MSVRLIPCALVAIALVLATACENPHASETRANAHRETGYDANERGDWSVAIGEYSLAIELDATARDYEERAYAHSGLGESTAAIGDFTAAIELDPRSASAYSQRALEYNILERWAEAIEDLDRAIELRPDRADQYNGRALAYLNLGNWDQALADASRALDIAEANDPIIPSYLANRATAYAELGEHELALEDLDRSVELDPDNLTSQIDRIRLLIELGRTDEARATASALATERGWPPVAINVLLADVFRALNRFDDAVGELDVAVELDPRSATLWIARATTYEDLGDLVAACADYGVAVDRASGGPTHDDATAALARLERSGACTSAG